MHMSILSMHPQMPQIIKRPPPCGVLPPVKQEHPSPNLKQTMPKSCLGRIAFLHKRGDFVINYVIHEDSSLGEVFLIDSSKDKHGSMIDLSTTVGVPT